ncbi:MAG: stage sporulation protein [Blastocatellia bacterium]|jgi:stage II sporulation protein D|nr:stage sporulation protein [Blastocatellia bacterium]
MRKSIRTIAILVLIASTLLSPIASSSLTLAQERDRRAPVETGAQKTWPSEPSSVAKKASESKSQIQLVNEPVMRIALSTDSRAATISTTAHLLNASESASQALPVETTRVRIESRMLSPARPESDRAFDLEVGRSLSRDEADRIVDQIRELTSIAARPVADSADKWKVVVRSQSPEEADDLSAKLEEVGFEVQLSGRVPSAKGPAPVAGNAEDTSSLKTAKPPTANKVRLTSRALAPSREVVAFARGAAPLLHSSAPLTFASSDETIAPVRFNDKPFRGKIEVFANTRGALTVVNVIGLEDYIRGVVPNELSYPAIEALKAQAIAARTYAVKNQGQFASDGYDLLPTTRSQVYRGLSSETALTSRAVEETRGTIATYNGEPINALYTSTCGGRTENAENIFKDASPYLRGRECAVEGKAAFAPFTIKTSRDLFDIKDEKDLALARDAALLAINGLAVPADKVSSSWLASRVTESEVREWLGVVARLARNVSFKAPDDAVRPPAFSTALAAAVYGDGRADTLLNSADADYLLSFRDGEQVPTANRADVAMLLRDGALSLFADATLRPKETMSRARVLHTMARVSEFRNLLALQKGTSRPAANGVMMLRSNKGKDLPIVVSREAFLFREFGENLFQMKSFALVGGEPVVFHVNPKGEVDYLEVRPAANGAAADRFSSVTNWTAELSLGAVQARLGRSVRGIGAITDLRVAAQGSSRRVIDLEVIGTQGVGHIRGGRIRSALGLKEQLFVIDRVYNENDRVAGFIFIGRGWGHGVGMCQFGAYGLAKQGLTVEQILKTYYTGIELTRMYQ